MNSTPPDHTIHRNHSSLLHGMGLVLFLLLSCPLMAEWDIRFTVPPYSLNETIVGNDGWDLQYKDPHPVYTDPMAALVVDSPVGNATQPTTLALETLLKNPAIKFTELGDRFVIEAQFAVTFDPRYYFDGGLYLRLASTDAASPFHFGFYYGEGGGLYYQGQGGRKVFLARGEMLENVVYRFVLRVDMSDQTFRVTVTSPGDDAYHYESEAVPFQESYTGGAGNLIFHMGNNMPSTMDAYIDYIKMSPLLE